MNSTSKKSDFQAVSILLHIPRPFLWVYLTQRQNEKHSTLQRETSQQAE